VIRGIGSANATARDAAASQPKNIVVLGMMSIAYIVGHSLAQYALTPTPMARFG
jgi:hypothetical protein